MVKIKHRCYAEWIVVTLSRTDGRRDAAVERTGMYSQRVLESVTTIRDYTVSQNK